MPNTIVHKEDIVEYVDFFSQEESELLINYLNSSAEDWEETCFFNARVMYPLAPLAKNVYPEINMDYFHSLRSRLQVAAEEVMGRGLKNLTLSAHKWQTGAYAGDHSDNSELDGTPNAWRENKLVTIIYLNDNYSGGELYFRDHNISIAPKAGSMIVFDVGIENVHGVKVIEDGDRYTMLASWDYADSVYPEEYYIQKELEIKQAEEEREKQRQRWELQDGYTK